MRRNELVDVRGWRGEEEEGEKGGGGGGVGGVGGSRAKADIPQASALIGPRLEKLMGSFRC